MILSEGDSKGQYQDKWQVVFRWKVPAVFSQVKMSMRLGIAFKKRYKISEAFATNTKNHNF